MKQIATQEATTVRAEEILQGECFRKKGGSYIYLRVSEAAVRFYIETQLEKDDPHEKVYGVCLNNGNMCRMSKGTQVWREDVSWLRRTY